MGVSFAQLPAVIVRYLLTIQITDLLDIAIMVFVLYKVLTLVQSTKAASLVKGLFVFLAALALSSLFHLNGINFIILFQPEIRRVLEQMGSRRFIAFFTHAETGNTMDTTIGQTVLACSEMSQSRTGALIVFEREILLDDMVRSGTVLDASVSSELLKNIFFVKAPMHDGAVIIRNGRVLGAGCMLRYRHERELRCGGGHRLRGERLHLCGHRRYAQAPPQTGNIGKPPAERTASAGGVRFGKAEILLFAESAPAQKERRQGRCRVI